MKSELDNYIKEENNKKQSLSPEEQCQKLFSNMIGNNILINSPIKNKYGLYLNHYLIYNDFTASGKGLKNLEEFIQKNILPTYANVHSIVGLCAEKTSKYFLESKDILRHYTNAYGNFSIIFHGQGTTGAIYKLIEVLSIKKYVLFYTNLKMAFNIRENFYKICGKNNQKQFEELCKDLLSNIKQQFNELFLGINFCYKVKENNCCITRCMLCKKNLENEGGYHKHINENCHLLNKTKYDNDPNNSELLQIHGNEQICEDFIDIIRKKYNIKNPDFINDLINDYKKFKPVIFYSIYEHNSNSLSWKETNCEICIINSESDNFYHNLSQKLSQYKDNYIKIGSFTSASNITGLLLDVDLISILLHKNGGFAFFDYASGSPYLKIDMSEPLPDEYRALLKFEKLDEKDKKYCFKDGIIFSPHKMLGGQNTPGVLIAHDRIYRNQLKPTQPGGGTVNFVYKNMVDYIQDVEFKEESGTPNILGGIRIGLAFLIRNQMPHDFIIKKDEYYNKLFREELENCFNLYILDYIKLKDKPHLPIYAIMISYDDKFFHPNFVCALLNDLFGIQSRPGCSCAPNYGQLLLGFDKDEKNFKLFQNVIYEGNEIFKPGYIRLNLPYFYPEYIIKYVIKSIKFICEYGHLFISLYKYNIKTGKFWFYNINDKSQENNTSLKLFNFWNNSSCVNDSYYENQHYDLISKEKLDKIFNEVENYVNNGDIYREMFYLKEKNIMPRIKDFDFGEWEKVRWFIKLKDVQDYLVKMYKSVVFGFDDQMTYESVEKNESKKLTRMKNWSIRSQT